MAAVIVIAGISTAVLSTLFFLIVFSIAKDDDMQDEPAEIEDKKPVEDISWHDVRP